MSVYAARKMHSFRENAQFLNKFLCIFAVAPHAGAWIEIAGVPAAENKNPKSPPMRGRGLKSSYVRIIFLPDGVAPHAGDVD